MQYTPPSGVRQLKGMTTDAARRTLSTSRTLFGEHARFFDSLVCEALGSGDVVFLMAVAAAMKPHFAGEPLAFPCRLLGPSP